MGYSMRDPDFNRTWDEILRERIFRSAAIYCCAEGAIRPEQDKEFRQRNVKVIEFPDDGTFAFIPTILKALVAHAPAPTKPGAQVGPHPEEIARDLERYVLISLQFSPTRQSRLVLVTKALVLEMLALSKTDVIDTELVLGHVGRVLGQDSPTLREATSIAVQELVDSKFVEPEDTAIRVSKSNSPWCKSRFVSQNFCGIQRLCL